MDFWQVIQGRRSIRRYKSQPVSRKQIEQVLEAARLAPSWKNQQCWRFLVVQDEKTIQMMADSFSEDNPGRQGLLQAPVVIVAAADPDHSGREDGKEYYLSDVAIACDHMFLAAHALGLGTCWMGWMDENGLKGLLAIPENLRIVGVTPLGYPDQSPKPRPRKELTDIVYFEQWGK